jgi:predicted ArsR family transcriptional regulator
VTINGGARMRARYDNRDFDQANRADAQGVEASIAQVEAFNCVFHALARQHPQVCKFDLAYLEGVSGRRIHHMECIVRGGHVCRFRIGDARHVGEPAVAGRDKPGS